MKLEDNDVSKQNLISDAFLFGAIYTRLKLIQEELRMGNNLDASHHASEIIKVLEKNITPLLCKSHAENEESKHE